jgi:hypothetical protein
VFSLPRIITATPPTKQATPAKQAISTRYNMGRSLF